MENLLILGTGCPKCHKLAENTREAAGAGTGVPDHQVTDLNGSPASGS